MNPVKLLELKGTDWMKGLSIQQDYPIGGMFRYAVNFDPFDTMGYLQPSYAPETVDSSVITTQIKYMVSGGTFGGTNKGYVYALGNRIGTGGKCFYRINTADNSVTEYGAQIMQNNPTGDRGVLGLAIFDNRIIYATDAGDIRSNTFTPAAVNDTLLLADAGVDTTENIAFAVGPDNHLYYTAHSAHGGDNNDQPAIGVILNVTGTSTNNNEAFVLGKGMVPRDIANTGTHLVIIEDNNKDKLENVTSRCRVLFWDCAKEFAGAIYDIPDSYLISVRYIDGKVLIIGTSGIWACSLGTAPKLIVPLIADRLPEGSNMVTTRGNIMYWGTSSNGAQIFAYGSKLGSPILFNPYLTDSESAYTALVSSGDLFYGGTDAPAIICHNSSSTRGSAALQTANSVLVQPYTFAFVKVVLKAPLASGQQLTVNVFDGNGQVIKDTDTKLYVTDGGKKTLIFRQIGSSQTKHSFEDVYVSVNPTGCVVQRVTVYGIPTDDFSQTI